MSLSVEEKKHWANFALGIFWKNRFIYWSSFAKDYQDFLNQLNYDKVLNRQLTLEEWFLPFGERVKEILDHPQGGEGAIKLAMDNLAKTSPGLMKGGLTRMRFSDAVTNAVKFQGSINTATKAVSNTVKEVAQEVYDFGKWLPYILGGAVLLWAYFELRMAKKLVGK